MAEILRKISGSMSSTFLSGRHGPDGVGPSWKNISEDQAIVLLEIGGNDLLGSTSPSDFEKDLGGLLMRVCRPRFVVMMFELPLPPFHNRYGKSSALLPINMASCLIPKPLYQNIGGKNCTFDALASFRKRSSSDGRGCHGDLK